MTQTAAPSRWKTYRRVPLAALLGAVLAFGASFAISPKYIAGTHLLINGTTSYLSTPGSTAAPVTLGSTDLATAMADTQAALTSSRDVAEAVVAQLKLDEIAEPSRGFIGGIKHGLASSYRKARGWITYGGLPSASKHDVAVDAVQRSLLAGQVKTSYVLDVAVVWDDPKVAAAIANAAADVLVAQSRKRYSDQTGSYQTQLKSQVDRAAAAQVDAQKVLAGYLAAHHITNVDAELQVSVQNRAALQQQADSLAAQLSSVQAQLRSTQQSLTSTPRTTCNKQDIATGRSNTQVSSCGRSATYDSLTTQVAGLRAQIDGITAQRSTVAKLLSSSVSSSKPLTAAQAELSQLLLTSTTAEQNFSTLSAQYQQSLLSAGQPNVEITHIDPASAPLLPSSPIRSMYLIIGLFLGALLSFLLVHARVLRRARLQAAEAALPAAASGVAVQHSNGVVDLVRLGAPNGIPPQAPSQNGHHVLTATDLGPHDPAGA